MLTTTYIKKKPVIINDERYNIVHSLLPTVITNIIIIDYYCETKENVISLFLPKVLYDIILEYNEGEIYVYAFTYNILKINHGMCGLKYSS